ncbi:MAG: right-handed parallel beta-helix repeat-containing protein, partial [Ignavibacteriales bacterium]|nr:right-handed parallel beta-helix repeat-containing protein [Ignavibacteriales bacterium]
STIAQNNGYGISMNQSSLILDSSFIYQNTQYGISGYYGITVRRNVFWGNGNAAIINVAANSTIEHNTIVSNAGGIKSIDANSNVVIRNNIIANNTGIGLQTTANPPPTVKFNNVYNNTTNYSGFSTSYGNLTSTNRRGDLSDVYSNVNLTPGFVDATNKNYHLLSASRMIDAGDTLTTKDADSTIADIGAFNYIQGTGSHTITATAGTNGSISPSGTVNVSNGSSQRFTFLPASGYYVDSVFVDNQFVDSTVGYTFTNVTSNHTISVRFALPTVSIKAQTGSSSYPKGTAFWVEVKVGDPNIISDLYGVSFKLKSNTAQCTYVANSAAAGDFLGANPLTFFTPVDTQTIDMAVTKTAAPGVSGSGIVAKAQFTTLSTLAQSINVVFSLMDVSATNSSGGNIPLSAATANVTITIGVSVWPGDCNNNGTVNSADVLPIGLYYGQTGPSSGSGTSWQAYNRTPWTAPTNRIYADANGNGTINSADVLAIGLNYGKTHTAKAQNNIIASHKVKNDIEQSKSKLNASLKPISNTSSYPTNTPFWIEVKVGDPNPIANLYGISFKLHSSLPQCKYITNSAAAGDFLGTNPLAFFQLVDSQTVDMAVSKTSAPSVSGSGIVAKAQFTSSVNGNVTFSLLDIAANDDLGNNIPIDPQTLTITIGTLSSDTIHITVGNVSSHTNEYISVPVTVAFPTNSSFASTEMEFSGFQNMLEFVGIDTTGTMLGNAGWMYQYNNTDTMLFTSSAGSSNISGSGTLFKLRFYVPSNATSGFIPININTAVFNTGSNPVVITNGGVNVVGPIIHYGDVDTNDTVQAFDAALVLKYLVGLITLNEQQRLNANVTCDTSISGLDASTILKRVVGLIDTLPYCSTFVAGGDINMNNGIARRGDSLFVPINLSNGNNILSFQGNVEYVPQHLQFLSIRWSPLLNSFYKDLRVTSDSTKVMFAGAGSIPDGQEGVFATLVFKVKNTNDNSTTISVKNLRWNENEIIPHAASATITITEVKDISSALPVDYNLEDCYPNPFNPITNFKFQIKENGFVTLSIFDMLGKEVAIVVNEELPAGVYSSTWNAANTPSGTYLYRLQVSNSGNQFFTETKKLLLMK